MSDENVVVFDIGSFYTRAGTAGDEAPSLIIPSVVSLDGTQPIAAAADDPHAVAILKRGFLTNTLAFEKFMRAILEQKLNATPQNSSALFSQDPFMHPRQRELMVRSCLEDLELKSMFMFNSSILTLYSLGKTSGLVIDIGDQLADVSAIIEGIKNEAATSKLNINGELLTKQSMQMLDFEPSTYDSLCFNDKEKYAKIKERLFEHAGGLLANDNILELPDGRKIEIQDENIQLENILFGKNTQYVGLQKVILLSSYKVNCEVRNLLFQNTVFCGGVGSSTPLSNSLQRELQESLPISCNVRLKNTNSIPSMPWAGASILCSMSNFTNMWITAAEYDDLGPSIINRRML